MLNPVRLDPFSFARSFSDSLKSLRLESFREDACFRMNLEFKVEISKVRRSTFGSLGPKFGVPSRLLSLVDLNVVQ